MHVEPDVAEVNVGAEASAESTSEAKADVDRRMAAVFAALEEMGIDEADMQTNRISIHSEGMLRPQVVAGPPVEDPREYRVTDMLRVTLRDAEMVGDALDAAAEAGANQVFGVSFTVSDERKWQDQAREKAMADAMARATELASLAGVELDEVQSVGEVIRGLPLPMAFGIESGGGTFTAPGQVEVGTQIQVTFAIR